MEKNSSKSHQKIHISKAIFSGMLFGGLIGIVIAFLHRLGILSIPVLNTLFYTLPFHEIIVGALLGIIIGGLIGILFKIYSPEKIKTEDAQKENASDQIINGDTESGRLQIKEEQLVIAKKWMQAAEVKVCREVFLEEKTFTVPIQREELVIRKQSTQSTASKQEDHPLEMIRIPLSEERVEFSKHKVTLEDVSIYKQQIKEIKHIEETLKREEPKVKLSGSPKVVDKSNSKRS